MDQKHGCFSSAGMLCAAGALELPAAEQDLPPFGEETACWVWHSEDGKLQVLLGLKTRAKPVSAPVPKTVCPDQLVVPDRCG